MNIALILAGGNGLRIKSSKIPKQFIEINNKPIIIHTIEKFLTNKKIDLIVISCHPEWIDYLNKYLNSYRSSNKKIYVVKGGANRNQSIANAIKYLNEINANDNDIVLTHDAVRMFVSNNIINKNIDACKKHHAVNTVIPAIDTVIVSNNHMYVCNVPDRKYLYNSQTPQTFHFKILKHIYLNNDVHDTSDVCKYVMSITKIKIALIMGENENFKITNDFDLRCAEIMVNKNN